MTVQFYGERLDKIMGVLVIAILSVMAVLVAVLAVQVAVGGC